MPEEFPQEIPPEEVTPSSEPPAPPAAISPDELQSRLTAQQLEYEKKMQDMERRTQEQLWQFATQQAQQPASTAPGLSDDDVIRVLTEGDDPKKLTSYITQKLTERDKQWEQKFNELNSNGSKYIKNLAIQQARTDPKMPYFQKYEREIKEILDSTQQADPENIRNVYTYVAGLHMDEILTEEREKMLRQQTSPTSLTPGSGKPTRTRESEEDEHYSPEVVLSVGNLNTLRSKNMDPDTYAAKRGFKNFKEFAKSRDELDELEREVNAVHLKGEGNAWKQYQAAKKERKRA